MPNIINCGMYYVLKDWVEGNINYYGKVVINIYY